MYEPILDYRRILKPTEVHSFESDEQFNRRYWWAVAVGGLLGMAGAYALIELAAALWRWNG